MVLDSSGSSVQFSLGLYLFETRDNLRACFCCFIFCFLHSSGVIAMSWCPSDSSYLLTCAKDNRTICWDIVSGEVE